MLQQTEYFSGAESLRILDKQQEVMLNLPVAFLNVTRYFSVNQMRERDKLGLKAASTRSDFWVV